MSITSQHMWTAYVDLVKHVGRNSEGLADAVDIMHAAVMQTLDKGKARGTPVSVTITSILEAMAVMIVAINLEPDGNACINNSMLGADFIQKSSRSYTNLALGDPTVRAIIEAYFLLPQSRAN